MYAAAAGSRAQVHALRARSPNFVLPVFRGPNAFENFMVQASCRVSCMDWLSVVKRLRLPGAFHSAPQSQTRASHSAGQRLFPPASMPAVPGAPGALHHAGAVQAVRARKQGSKGATPAAAAAPHWLPSWPRPPLSSPPVPRSDGPAAPPHFAITHYTELIDDKVGRRPRLRLHVWRLHVRGLQRLVHERRRRSRSGCQGA